MLKCLTISTVNEPFGSSNGEADLTFAGTEASLSTNGEMGVDRRFSEFIGNDLMASATSYLKGYMLTSLSDISGTSSVAIDNKIEQAMDLVKSHLMFAVREEVEVLKEQIKELVEKNSQLEYENSILRADATPETLAKLQTIGQP